MPASLVNGGDEQCLANDAIQEEVSKVLGMKLIQSLDH